MGSAGAGAMSDVQPVFYRYPPRTLVGDYVRAGLGVAFGLLVMGANPFDPWLHGIFGLLTAAFAVFGLRTLRQHVTQVAVTPDGVFVKDVGTRGMPWPGLDQVKLRFYGTRRQSQGGQIVGGGFLQLTLRGRDVGGEGRKFVFDSHLVGFKDVAWHAARAARDNAVELDPTTAGNLLDIGVDADGESPRPTPEERLTL
jgi:hypothetical protein